MDQYEIECSKRKARAEKFGTTYVPPKLEDFIPWSDAKKIKSKPIRGFVTGFDISDAEEVRKREARKQRFLPSKNDEQKERPAPNNDAPSPEKDEQRTCTLEPTCPYLPTTQAWDKNDLLSMYRNDPPNYVEKDEPSISDDNAGVETVVWVREKVHIFAIDWAAFKQMRNKDIMTCFEGYGPTYIEWLSDLSCNVHFGDKFSARRALMNLSQSIPSPPPEDVLTEKSCPDLGKMGWRFCLRPIQKVRGVCFDLRRRISVDSQCSHCITNNTIFWSSWKGDQR